MTRSHASFTRDITVPHVPQEQRPQTECTQAAREYELRVTTHLHETRLIYMRHDSFIHDKTYSYVTWRIHKLWPYHMRHDSFTRDVMPRDCVTRSTGSPPLKRGYSWIARTSGMHTKTLPHVTRLVHMWHDLSTCDITHSRMTTHPLATRPIHIWHDPSTCDTTQSWITWRIHMWHDSITYKMTLPYETRPIHRWHDSSTCDMTHSYMTWLIHMWHYSFAYKMTHPHVTRLIHIWHD